MKVALVLLLIAVIPAYSMFLPVTSRPLCITIEETSEKQIYFYYEVTGNNPEYMKVEFQPIVASIMTPTSLNGQSGKTSFLATQVKVCFISTDGGYKSVSIDFYSEDVAHLAQLAKKSDLYELHTKLINVGEKIK